MRERPPGSLKEDSIKLAVVLKEHPKAFWDSKDRMAMRDVFDNFAIDMLSKLDCSLCSAGWTDPTTLARERDKERVLAAIAVYPGGTMSEDAAV